MTWTWVWVSLPACCVDTLHWTRRWCVHDAMCEAFLRAASQTTYVQTLFWLDMSFVQEEGEEEVLYKNHRKYHFSLCQMISGVNCLLSTSMCCVCPSECASMIIGALNLSLQDRKKAFAVKHGLWHGLDQAQKSEAWSDRKFDLLYTLIIYSKKISVNIHT